MTRFSVSLTNEDFIRKLCSVLDDLKYGHKTLPHGQVIDAIFHSLAVIDLLAIQLKSLDRASFLYIFIHEIRLSGVRASITIVPIRKFYEM